MHFYSARATISADRGWRLRAPDSSVRKARCLYTRIVVTGSKGREEAKRVGGGNGDGNGVGNGDVNGDGSGRGVEANEETQDGKRGRERGRGWRPVDEHRMGTGTGAGTETRAVAEMGMGTGSGRAEERRRSARDRTRLVDAMWETGETWVER